MEFLSAHFHGLMQRILPSGQTQSTRTVSRMDAYLNFMYRLLIWENPKSSGLTLGTLLVLFWLIVQLGLRFYGVVFIVILLVLLCDLYFERKDLKAQRNDASDKIRQVASFGADVILYLKVLRKENPSVFCVTMCGLFLCLTVVARNISGLTLANLALIALFSGPYVISKMPPEYFVNFKKVVQTFGTNEGVLAESELLPFLTNKDLAERDPDLDSLLTDKTADSVTNSLISGIITMPSYLDAEGGSLDGLEEEDLEFPLKSTRATAVSYTPGECSSDSDSDHKKVNRDLIDDASNNSQNKANENAGILGNLTSLGSSLISNVLNKTTTSAPKRKDSDSEFEIIDSEEIDE